MAMVLQTRQFQFGAFLYGFKILSGLNPRVLDTNGLVATAITAPVNFSLMLLYQ